MEYTVRALEDLLKEKGSHTFMFITKSCKHCTKVEKKLLQNHIHIDTVDCGKNTDLGKAFGIKNVPTLIEIVKGKYKFYEGDSIIEKLIDKKSDTDLGLKF